MSLTLIVTGMHRSGTSLTASLIQAMGIHLGENLVEADTNNIKGYFEDIDFLEFQRSVLLDCCRSEEPGWPDWGWTECESLDKSKFQNYIETAKNLIRSRQEKMTIWGWKDPRTTLMLDFWEQLLPEAKYLLVYRFPWDVENSISRLKAPVFLENPDYPARIWSFYNRNLLDFYLQNKDRSILLNINALLQHPHQLVELLKNKLGINFIEHENPLKTLYNEQIFKQLNWNSPGVENLYNKNYQSFSILEELDKNADLPSSFSLEKVSWYLSRMKQSDSLLNGERQPSSDLKELSLNQPDKEIQQLQLKNESFATVKRQTLVSVVIPCFNQGEFILEAISSVESCQDRLYEIVIINDCSTEPLTVRVLDYLQNKGYCVIDHGKNKGLAEARNTGIEKAEGKYILPLDADNKIRPGYITKAIEVLEQYPEVGVVYSDAEFFGERTGLWEVPEFDIHRLAMRNFIDACAVFRKEVWQDCGGYDAKIPDKLGYEDWDFWLGAAEKGWKFYHIPEVLFDYRVRGDSMVGLCRIPENHEKLFRYICTKHLNLYTTNFAIILAAKDAALLREEIRSESFEMQLQETQTVLMQTQESNLKETQFALAQAQEQLQAIQTAWQQAQAEIQQIHVSWERSQTEIRHSHAEWEKAQQEIQQIYPAWQRSQQELQQVYTGWNQTQEEMQRIQAAWTQAQEELQHIQAAWQQGQVQLQQSQTELAQAQAKIRQMESSKLWQLRQSWLRLKQALGFRGND